MFPFKLIGRYLGASFALPFVVTLIFTLTFLLSIQMFKIVELVMNTGVPVKVVMVLMGHMIMYTLPLALPLSVLFSTLFLFNRLSLDSEYTVMRAAGISRYKILLPIFLVGLSISVSIFEFSKEVIPHSTTEFKNMVAFLTSKGYITSIKEGHFFTDIPGVTLFSEKVTDEGTKLKNVFISFKNSKDDFERIIFAQDGLLVKINENEMGAAKLRLKLFNGNMVKVNTNGDQLEKVLFNEYDFPISSGTLMSGSALKDSMRSNRELREIINLKPKELEKKKMSLKDFNSAKIEFYNRHNLPLQCLVFVVLGFVLGVQPTRGKGKNTGLITLLILVSYYAVFFLGISLTKSGKVDPIYVVFLPTIIMGAYSLYQFKKLDWVS